MALKRKIDNRRDPEPRHESHSKRHAPDLPFLKDDFNMSSQMLRNENSPWDSMYGNAPRTEWTSESERRWRTLGTKGVPYSLPLSNLVSAVQDLIDPDFDPSILALDDEPRYLKPLPSRMPSEDIDYLRQRGALTIPHHELRNELLRCYIQWVYNFMPTLDLHEFLRCIVENDPNGNISLLLFQAVMFAGTAFIDFKHLQAAGYETRQDARKAFFARVRHLYAFDYEDDRLVVLQTLLLMTYWSDYESSPQKDIWHWIGVCNTQAQSIGLHRDPTRSDMDPTTQRLRIRLWWSLYSRDRLIAMGLRRPTQINEGTCDVPMLRLSDCDIKPFPPSVIRALHCPQLQDVSHQRRLATMFIEKAKLCQCLGRVLFAQYSPSNHQFGATNKTTITLVPRQASEAELARCAQKLDTWLTGRPKEAQFIPTSKNDIRDGENVLLLHSAMLRMIYHATSSALHRPRALTFADKHQSNGIRLCTIARTKMEDAATSITHIVQGLSQLNLVKFLPQSGVTVLLPATLAHLANLTSANPAVRQMSIYNFHRCIQVLHGLKDMYPAADIEAARIEAAVKMQCMNSNISISTTCNDNFNLGRLGRASSPTIISEVPADSPDSHCDLADERGYRNIDDAENDDVGLFLDTNANTANTRYDIDDPRSTTFGHALSNDFDTALNADYPEVESFLHTAEGPPDVDMTGFFEGLWTGPDATQKELALDMDWTEDVLKVWTEAPESSGEIGSGGRENNAAQGSSADKTTKLSTHNDNGITGDLDRDLGFV